MTLTSLIESLGPVTVLDLVKGETVIAYIIATADALYAFKSRGFGGEIRVVEKIKGYWFFRRCQ